MDWIKDFDSRILYSSQGKPISYGWGYYSPFIESDWIRCFTKGRARKYYQKHPVKEEEDKALCQDICPLSVLHGLVKLLETRPNVCYGSYEIQIVCHPIKSLLVRHNRSIPEFLKRLLTLYDESEDSYFGYITPNMNDEIRRKEIPKHLQIMIAIFLTENFTFLTTRTIGDPDANPPTTEEVFSARVNDIKAPRRFDEFVISNLYPGKSVWSYTLDNNREVAKYLDQCIAKWRKYMYEPNSEAFVIKPLLTSEKMCITLDSYY